MSWSTKETPTNAHTKGSLKFKNALLTINENNEAILTELTLIDKFRLRNQKLGFTRVIFKRNSFYKALENNEFEHTPFKAVLGACGTSFYVCDLKNKEDVTFAGIKYGDEFRILMPNEAYYAEYDKNKAYIDEIEYFDEEED